MNPTSAPDAVSDVSSPLPATAAPGRGAPKGLFLKKFLRQGTRVASVAPSSQALARAVCRHVSHTHPQTIVELGAGTGAITSEICRRMHPESRLVALEIDVEFAAITTRLCPRATVLCADVRQLPDVLRAQGLEKFDLLLSGLPTPSLPRTVNRVVLQTFEAMAPQAWFSQLTVMPYVYMPMYRRLFAHVDFDLVVRNLPPGGVYHCRQLHEHYLAHLPGGR